MPSYIKAYIFPVNALVVRFLNGTNLYAVVLSDGKTHSLINLSDPRLSTDRPLNKYTLVTGDQPKVPVIAVGFVDLQTLNDARRACGYSVV